MAVHSGESRLFPEYFRQFLLYLVAAQAAREDGSVGGEEDDFGDSVDAVKFRGNCLRVQDLRIWDRLVFDGTQRSLRLIFHCHSKCSKVAVFVLLVGGDDVRYLLATGTAPRGPEVNKYILAAPYEIAQTGGFAVVLYSKVSESIAFLWTG